MEIGSHSINHLPLTKQSVDVREEEIKGSKEILQKICRKEASSFFYPYGINDGDIQKIVRSAGYKAACGTQLTKVESNAELYCLPRFWAQNWNLDEFKSLIERFMNG